MRDSLKPKAIAPDELILQKMAVQSQPQPTKTVGKHRLNLSLPVDLFDELREESEKRGLTVTAYLVTLIHKSLGKEIG